MEYRQSFDYFANNIYDFAVFNKKIEYGKGSLNDLGSYGAKKSLVEVGSFFETDIDLIEIKQVNSFIGK